MTLTYEYGSSLYINLTNKCSNRCDFCLRNNSSGSLYAADLWFHGAEPAREEIFADLKRRDLSAYQEIVFCGYGEPTCRFDDMLWLCSRIKALGPYKIRLNTNGQADLIAGRSTAPELKGCLDVVSVSLNGGSAAAYDSVCHSVYGPAAYEAVLRFTKEAVQYVPTVVMTVVDTMSKEEIDRCREICLGLGADFRVRSYIKA